MDDQVAADPVDRGQFQHGDRVQRGEVASPGRHHPHGLDPDFVGRGGQTAFHDRLGAEALHRPDAGDGLFDHAGQSAALALQVGDGLPDAAGEALRRDSHQRQGHHRHYAEDGAGNEQDDGNGHRQGGIGHPERGRRHHRLYLEQVTGHPGQQLAPVDIGVVGNVEGEEVVVEPTPQLGLDVTRGHSVVPAPGPGRKPLDDAQRGDQGDVDREPVPLAGDKAFVHGATQQDRDRRRRPRSHQRPEHR